MACPRLPRPVCFVGWRCLLKFASAGCVGCNCDVYGVVELPTTAAVFIYLEHASASNLLLTNRPLTQRGPCAAAVAEADQRRRVRRWYAPHVEATKINAVRTAVSQLGGYMYAICAKPACCFAVCTIVDLLQFSKSSEPRHVKLDRLSLQQSHRGSIYSDFFVASSLQASRPKAPGESLILRHSASNDNSNSSNDVYHEFI